MSSSRNKFDLSGIDFRASEPVKPKARAEAQQTQHISFKQMMVRHQPELVAHQSGGPHLSKTQLKQNARILQNGSLDHEGSGASTQLALHSADRFANASDTTDQAGPEGAGSAALGQGECEDQGLTLEGNKNGQSLGVTARALLATRGSGTSGAKLTEPVKAGLKNLDIQTEGGTEALSSGESSSSPDVVGSLSLETLLSLGPDSPMSAQQQGLASDNSTSALVNPSQLHIPTFFGQEAWAEAFEQKLTWLVKQNDQQATLTLNPPELGPLKIVLHIQHNVATASFSSDNPEVRQALAAQQASLRESFSRQNIVLEQVTVHDNGAQAQAGNKNPDRTAAQALSLESSAAKRSDVTVDAAPSLERPERTLSQKLVNLYA
jgi:flagellar hook-length control protein FliK